MANTGRFYSTLSELENDNAKPEIVVRLIRKWDCLKRRNRNHFRSQELLLLDETGSLIKAFINHRLFPYYHNNMLNEGSIYYISNFCLEEEISRPRLTNHRFCIQFTHLTTAAELLDDVPNIEKSKFHIHEHDSLVLLANQNKILPDVVGRITYVWGSELHNLGSEHKIMATLLLRNGRKVHLSIWDNIARDFRMLLSATQWIKGVITITSVNPKLFTGELYLNTSSSTRFYVTDEVNEIRNLRQHRNGYLKPPFQALDINELDVSMKTIAQILTFLDTEDIQITEIVTRNGWYYISCPDCLNKIKPVDNKLICSYCLAVKVGGQVRLRLEVIAEVETDRTKFMIFDKDARIITNMSAEEVVQQNFNIGNEFPQCLQQLIGKQFIFQTRLTAFDFQAGEETLLVTSIADQRQ
ncbi:unnamed protein product [Microthlaspi erraticum]|uniref:Replication factor A C-terminal domain-containing protein n=1 Tax=Microthlaspi erraticum TaxID=1685480 RepID=A0A6D2JCK1_9BRAS|nr:unnamed protein product [Microthlaspi erraticum]